MIKVLEHTIEIDLGLALNINLIQFESELSNALHEFVAKNSNTIHELNMFSGEIVVKGKVDKMLVEDAPGNMLIAEFREINRRYKHAQEIEKIAENPSELLFGIRFNDPAIIKVAKKSHPMLSEREIILTLRTASSIFSKGDCTVDRLVLVKDLLDMARSISTYKDGCEF